tara:strand:- start:407 stop:631 length:225 start_codon:yes stop_codon:yes gene_type:complete
MSEQLITDEINNDTIDLSTYENRYKQIKTLIESMESDVLKSEKGNKAASVRLRKGLRLLKSQSGDFVKFTLGKL